MNAVKLKFLVTGTGRCGTAYMAKLLSSVGVMCGHEAIFTFDGLERAKDRLAGRSKIFLSPCCVIDPRNRQKLDTNWFDASKIAADASYMATPFLKDDIFNDTKIIHLVRDPLKVISSQILDAKFFTYPCHQQILWQRFVIKTMPEISSIENAIERACYFYVKWNNMISKSRPSFVHKVENGLSNELCDFLNLTEKIPKFNVSNQTNHWGIRKKDITLDEIPKGSIRDSFLEKASFYGYNYSEISQ